MEMAKLSMYSIHGKPLLCSNITLPCACRFKQKHFLDQKIFCEKDLLVPTKAALSILLQIDD